MALSNGIPVSYQRVYSFSAFRFPAILIRGRILVRDARKRTSLYHHVNLCMGFRVLLSSDWDRWTFLICDACVKYKRTLIRGRTKKITSMCTRI